MGVAFLSAMRSKDPSTQVGACLVDTENKIVGIGTLMEREGGRDRRKAVRKGRSNAVERCAQALFSCFYVIHCMCHISR